VRRSFSLREKDRRRGIDDQGVGFSDPLTPALSRRERGIGYDNAGLVA
jgi:hypothetical protein